MKKLTFFLALILTINLTSAVIINSVAVDTFSPGQEGQIRIEVENNQNDIIRDVSLTLNFQNLPFIPIGTSGQSIDEIDEDDEEEFLFKIKAATEITPKDYEIPYTLEYEINNDDKTRTGTIGVKVKANPELTFTVDTDNAVQGEKGKITFKVINKGDYDARFVSIKVLPEGFTLLSDDEVYLGTVDSDDFETETFDVIFNSLNTNFLVVLEYKNFDNEKIIQSVELPLKVYSWEKAVKLGIVQPDKTVTYILLALALLVIIVIWRIIKKRRRLKRSMNQR